MVCEKCEKKRADGTLGAKLVVFDKWKEGANNTSESGGRVRGENRLLSRARYNPYGRQCKVCKAKLHEDAQQWCHTCAYQKGICAMCGVQILETKDYKMSTV